MKKLYSMFQNLMPIVFLITLGCKARAAPEEVTPEQEISWGGSRGGFVVWGDSEDAFYGVSVKPLTLDVYRWQGRSVDRKTRLELDTLPLSLALLPSSQFVVYDHQSERHESWFRVHDLLSGKTLSTWLADKEWSHTISCGSQQGGRVVVWASPEVINPDFLSPAAKIKIGLFNSETHSIDWLVNLTGKIGSESVRAVVASNNRRFIAVAGWQYEVTMIDVVNKKVSWHVRPTSETSVTCAAFSADGKRLYAGGVEGCVFGIDVLTAKIVSQWFATTSGQEEYGHRISTISVSPDGKSVAAGTGPEGQVFVFQTEQEAPAHIEPWLLNNPYYQFLS